MLVQRSIQNKKAQKPRLVLYSCVFDSFATKVAVFLLFTLLLLQPIAPVYASTEDTAEAQLEEIVIDTEPIVVTEEVAEDSDDSSEEITLDVLAGDVKIIETNESEENGGAIELSDVTVEESASTTTQTEVLDPITQNPSVSGETGTTTNTVEEEVVGGDVVQEEVIPTPVGVSEIASSTPETPEVPFEEAVEVLATTTATSTQEQIPISVHNASAFSFDTTECAVVGEGAYYCSEKSVAENTEDGVFSAPDLDGDLEIYVRVNGEESQITHNQVDDSAPHYDAHSERIVWHSIVSDRYQIISYDIETGEKTRITDASYNNMEPVAYEDVTLWQAWIDNNWEIMLYKEGAIHQITNNTQNDISPHMKDGYVVWQSQFEDGWQVAVYDQVTKKIEYISSEGGLKIENPRFVLVYDSTDQNGDMRTVGYDFDSKTSFNLGILPQEIPDELPEPDQTGETRALIQNKQSGREGETDLLEIVPEGGNGPDGTLDLALSVSSSSTPTESTSTVSDLVVENYASSSIPVQAETLDFDLVIPPFTGTSSVEMS